MCFTWIDESEDVIQLFTKVMGNACLRRSMVKAISFTYQLSMVLTLNASNIIENHKEDVHYWMCTHNFALSCVAVFSWIIGSVKLHLSKELEVIMVD